MRKWYKFILNFQDKEAEKGIDTTFEDHKNAMGGYPCKTGYNSKEDFFQTYFHPNHRLKKSQAILESLLKKKSEILSIGSGRAVNEILLHEKGFNITCSDLEQPCKEETLRIFNNLKYINFDVLKSPSSEKYDQIFNLNMLYLFDKKNMDIFFKNVFLSLKPGGTFILDGSCGKDDFRTKFTDNVLVRVESHLLSLIYRLKGKDCIVTKKFHGYRMKDEDIISIAQENGFELKSITTKDYVTEISRIKSVDMLLFRILKLQGLFEKIKLVPPYVRIFEFEKK